MGRSWNRKKVFYNWASIDEENQISRWRKEGKHLVLRFVCDIPSDEEHMDIPEWLYEKSGEAGRWYDGEDGKGFAPDYNNPTIISCHRKAVRAIGEHFGQDGLISYVEHRSMYSYVRLSIDRCTATYV